MYLGGVSFNEPTYFNRALFQHYVASRHFEMEPPMVTRLFFLYTYRPYDDVVVGVGENPSFYEFGETKLHDFS